MVAAIVSSRILTLQGQSTPNMAWGNVASVSNGILTIVTYASSAHFPTGAKMSFVLNPETKIICGDCGSVTRNNVIAVSEIENYHRIRVEYVQRAGSTVATNIVLSSPIRKSTAIPPVAAHAREAEQHFRRGLALHNKGDIDSAIVEYRKSISLNPYYQNAHNNLGNALDEQGKQQEAIKEYNAALNLNPFYAAAHYNLAITLQKMGDTVGAEQHFLSACPAIPSKYCPSQASGNGPIQDAEQYCGPKPPRLNPGPHAHFGNDVAWARYGTCVNSWLRSHGYQVPQF